MPDKQDLRGVDPSEYKNIPGNQTAGTPDVDESRRGEHGRDHSHEHNHGAEQHSHGHSGGHHDDTRGVDPSEFKNIPGNQTANTPDVNESDR